MVYTHILSLVVLQDAAHGAGGSTQCGVETVNIGLLDIGLLLVAISYLKVARLVIGAVGAGHKLFVFTPIKVSHISLGTIISKNTGFNLLEWEPCLQVVLLGSLN